MFLSKTTNISTFYSTLGYKYCISFYNNATITFDNKDNDSIIALETIICNKDEELSTTNYFVFLLEVN